MRWDFFARGEHFGNCSDHHLAHVVVGVGVGVDVLDTTEGWIGVLLVVEVRDCFDEFVGEFFGLEFLGEQVEIEEGTKIFFFGGNFDGAGVEPADEHFEGEIFFVWKAVGFVFLDFGIFVFIVGVEDVGEEGRVVTEKPFVDIPVCVLLSDIDVDHG